MTPADKKILALQRAARNPKYRVKIKAKIKKIRENIARNNWLAQ